jgi:hypothetical protein
LFSLVLFLCFFHPSGKLWLGTWMFNRAKKKERGIYREVPSYSTMPFPKWIDFQRFLGCSVPTMVIKSYACRWWREWTSKGQTRLLTFFYLLEDWVSIPSV